MGNRLGVESEGSRSCSSSWKPKGKKASFATPTPFGGRLEPQVVDLSDAEGCHSSVDAEEGGLKPPVKPKGGLKPPVKPKLIQ